MLHAYLTWNSNFKQVQICMRSPFTVSDATSSLQDYIFFAYWHMLQRKKRNSTSMPPHLGIFSQNWFFKILFTLHNFFDALVINPLHLTTLKDHYTIDFCDICQITWASWLIHVLLLWHSIAIIQFYCGGQGSNLCYLKVDLLQELSIKLTELSGNLVWPW